MKDRKEILIACVLLAISLVIAIFCILDEIGIVILPIGLILFLLGLYIFLFPANGNNLFNLCTYVSVIFVIFPLLLRNDRVSDFTSFILYELKTSEYKSTYIEALGALLGSFLAITGALWVERRMKTQQNKEDDTINARIVYYDFKFAFTQIKDILEQSNINSSSNLIEDHQNFANYREFAKNVQGYLVLIDDEWIRTVSCLPTDGFTELQREHLYFLYDYLCRIKCLMEKCPENIPNDIGDVNSDSQIAWKKVYTTMYKLLLIAPEEFLGDLATVILDDKARENRKRSKEVWEALLKQARIPR